MAKNDMRAIMVQSHKEAAALASGYRTTYAKAHRLGLKRAWAASRVSRAAEERQLGLTILSAAAAMVFVPMFIATGVEALMLPALFSFCGAIYGGVCTWMAVSDRKDEAAIRAVWAEVDALDTIL